MEEILSSIRRIIADEEGEEGHTDEAEAAQLEVATGEVEDDDDLADPDDEEDVLELTKVVRESGEVVDLRTDEENVPLPAEEEDAKDSVSEEPVPEEQEPSLEDDHERPVTAAAGEEADAEVESEMATPGTGEVVEQDASQEDAAVVPKQAAREELLSDAAANVATGAFAKLSHAFQRTSAEESIADGDGRTIEQFAEDMMRPLLREWLDEKLPPIVERLVEKEIHKIARRAELM